MADSMVIAVAWALSIGVLAFGFMVIVGAISARKENSVVATTIYTTLGVALMFVAVLLFLAAIP